MYDIYFICAIKRRCQTRDKMYFPTTYFSLNTTINVRSSFGDTPNKNLSTGCALSWVFSNFFKQIQITKRHPYKFGFEAFAFKWIPKIL